MLFLVLALLPFNLAGSTLPLREVSPHAITPCNPFLPISLHNLNTLSLFQTPNYHSSDYTPSSSPNPLLPSKTWKILQKRTPRPDSLAMGNFSIRSAEALLEAAPLRAYSPEHKPPFFLATTEEDFSFLPEDFRSSAFSRELSLQKEDSSQKSFYWTQVDENSVTEILHQLNFQKPRQIDLFGNISNETLKKLARELLSQEQTEVLFIQGTFDANVALLLKEPLEQMKNLRKLKIHGNFNDSRFLIEQFNFSSETLSHLCVDIGTNALSLSKETSEAGESFNSLLRVLSS